MYIIRTSDRGQFKRCRRAWDQGSKIRKNFEPNVVPKPLTFGTAIHASLEEYYNPATWDWDREVVQAQSFLVFMSTLNSQIDAYLKHTNKDALSEEETTDYEERRELGMGMLENYFSWAPQQDEKWTPKYTEIEFEVPVIVSKDIFPLPIHFGTIEITSRGFLCFQLTYMGEPVMYQGRLDAIMEDSKGKYWIWDHKTTAQLGDTSHLEMDEQCGSYCWAIQTMLGIKIEGVIYNELFKGVPHKPALLKKGGLSKNKQQNTTYNLYMETIKEYNLNVADYQEYLEFLLYQGNKFFRRVQVHRNQRELLNLQDTICMEAIDMLNDPMIYPNPTRVNCSGCMHRTPCLAMNDGSDVSWILKENYHQRTSDEEAKLDKSG